MGDHLMPDAEHGRLFTEQDVKLMLADAIEQVWNADDEEPLGAITERVLATASVTFPADEPLFLLRASGEQAEEALGELLHGYSGDAIEWPIAERAYSDFIRWRHDHPNRVEAPG